MNEREKPQRHEAKETPSSQEEESLLYGLHPVKELLGHQPDQIEEIYLSEHPSGALVQLGKEAASLGILIRYRPRPVLDRMLPGKNHQGIAARRRSFVYAELESLLHPSEERPLLFLSGVQDPGNLGSLLRSCKAFDGAGVVLSERESCAVTATVVKASAGAASLVPIARVRNEIQALQKLKEAGFWILGLVPGAGSVGQNDFPSPAVFVLGGEGAGLKPSLQKHCDMCLGIPMAAGWDSLNVGVCGGIVLFEWQRQVLQRAKKSLLKKAEKDRNREES